MIINDNVCTAIGRSLVFIYLIWIVFVINLSLKSKGIDLCDFGMVPRSMQGTLSVLFMHFLHENFSHITFNSILIFSILIPLFMFFDENHHMFMVIVKICLLGGVLLWCVGRPSVHLGSSMLYYGLVSYMVFGSLVHHKSILLIYSFITLTFNSVSLISGLLPHDNVSWEGHLCGAFAGFCVALQEKINYQ
jgi:membrane associated rhomboid family serine protease